MEELKDIKGIIDVPDYSLWILLSMIVGLLLCLILAIYYFKNRRKKRKRLTLKQIAMKNLSSVKGGCIDCLFRKHFHLNAA